MVCKFGIDIHILSFLLSHHDLPGSGVDSSPAQQVVDEIKKNGGTAVADYHSVEVVYFRLNLLH